MEYSVLILVFALSLFRFVADIAVGIIIENCSSETPLDIEEKVETNITCKDVNDTAWNNWSIKRQNEESIVMVAICTPTPFNCTALLPGQVEVQRSAGQVQLLYTQKNRTEDFNAEIQCKTVPNQGGNSLQSSCRLNVISPAILSDCVVEEDRVTGTVNGICHFEHAFSAVSGMTCTWFQSKSSDQTQKQYAGQIQKEDYTSGEVYQRGNCTLSASKQLLDNVEYTYSINFYPGSGRLPVSIVRLGPTGSGSSPNGRRETTQGGANEPDAERDSLPIGAIAGGAGAAVVVLVVVVVIVVVVIRRRRKSAGLPKTSAEDDYWEEHINTAYVSGDDLQTPGPHQQRPSPTTANGTNVGTRHLAAAANGDYEDADIPGVSFSLDAAEEGFDGYAAIGSARQQTGTVPERGADKFKKGTNPGKKAVTDTYAVVDKSRKGADPNRNGTPAGNETVTDTYAVVEKSRKGADPNRNGTPAGNETVNDTYAVVDKARKRNDQPRTGPVQDRAEDEAAPEEDTYSHLQLSSTAVKPVPPKKPSRKEVTEDPASDDVYNRVGVR